MLAGAALAQCNKLSREMERYSCTTCREESQPLAAVSDVHHVVISKQKEQQTGQCFHPHCSSSKEAAESGQHNCNKTCKGLVECQVRLHVLLHAVLCGPSWGACIQKHHGQIAT
jgi:hypothetical protein